MQLYALDETVPIIATRAKKEKRYLCPECKNFLKVRSGPSRQPHFYHLSSNPFCRQHEKSEEHIALQLKLLDLIGSEAQIEAQFPSIKRIADVAWHQPKIVFEIQCSSISLQEAQERCVDYKRAGYLVIWILHDKRFNKKQLSAAEWYLRQEGCYFTNINKCGAGEIYDQFEVIKEHKRLFKGSKLPLNPIQLLLTPQIQPPDIAFPQLALQRLCKWKLYTKGDLLHRLMQEETLEKTAKHLLSIENHYLSVREKAVKKRLPLLTLFLKAYSSLVHLLIRKIG